LRKIIQQCTIPLKGTRRGKFVTKCAETVLERLKFGYVILIGHSYGGLVASMVVRKLLADGFKLTKLKTITLIYVPSKDKVKDADITHLMAVGDVALRCNRLKSVAADIQAPQCQTTLYRRRICILVFCGRTGRVESAQA
jgi:alpha/beta superfamily hydrolase